MTKPTMSSGDHSAKVMGEKAATPTSLMQPSKIRRLTYSFRAFSLVILTR